MYENNGRRDSIDEKDACAIFGFFSAWSLNTFWFCGDKITVKRGMPV
jgi:hypothetical protein